MIHVLKQTFFYLLALAVILLIAHLPTVEAQDDEPEVTYCQDLVTGEIRVVAEGMPCPYPMAEM